MTVLLDSALVVFREGLEAVLVLAALAAMLRRAAPERMSALGLGALGGVLASLAAAAAYAAFLGGEHDDRIEAATCAVAALLMLWTSGWLASHAGRDWAAGLRAQAGRALEGRNVALAVAGIGFLAVFREGAETVLFLSALGAGTHLAEVLAGTLAAALVLAVVWRIVSRGAVRLPLRPLFLGTSIFLLAMAARFAAAAVQELQEQAILSFTPLDLPAPLEALGVPDSLEAVLAAALILAAAGAAALLRRLRAPRPAPALPAAAE